MTNKGSVDASYDLGYVGLSDLPGVDYSFPDGPTVFVPAGGSATFRVELTANAALMKHPRDVTMAAIQGTNPRFYMSDESGYVTLTPTVGASLRRQRAVFSQWYSGRIRSRRQFEWSCYDKLPGGPGGGTIHDQR